jgi:hypothetical protein
MEEAGLTNNDDVAINLEAQQPQDFTPTPTTPNPTCRHCPNLMQTTARMLPLTL